MTKRTPPMIVFINHYQPLSTTINLGINKQGFVISLPQHSQKILEDAEVGFASEQVLGGLRGRLPGGMGVYHGVAVVFNWAFP